MFSRSKPRKRFSISAAITRRWIRSRPGSVLILVIALLVLLALIGTAYLSSTQTERYTSVQNTVNTQADLLIDGLILNVENKITSNLYGTGANSATFRPPGQDMPIGTPPVAIVPTGYNTFSSPATDDFLAERVPTLSSNVFASTYPIWNSISWSVFPDTSGTGLYAVDSPFDVSATLVGLADRSKVISIPTSRTVSGQTYPAMAYYVPSSVIAPTKITTAAGVETVAPPGEFLWQLHTDPTGPGGVSCLESAAIFGTALQSYNFVTTSASGDGVADSQLVKVPVGPIDGITYYAGVRVIDDNSAVNVSTAWSAAVDPSVAAPMNDSSLADATAQTTNYGFFRSNVGLRELLASSVEMDYLNAYRFDNTTAAAPSPTNTSPSTVTLSIGAAVLGNTGVVPPGSTLTWYSVDGVTPLAGDAIETQLARRPLNPGYNVAGLKYNYLDKAQSAVLAQRFSLVNATSGQSLIEQLLPYETYYKLAGGGALYPHTPYSPGQIVSTSGVAGTTYWYGDLFNFSFPTTTVPIRTLLTASNPVSNGIASRYGPTTPGSTWSATGTYNFGDWVVSPTDHKSYLCVLPVLAISPVYGIDPTTSSVTVPLATAPNPPTPEYWAPVPWKYQPTKASVNTASFEELWLNFCHVMTDTIPNPANTDVTGLATVPQWQPPLLPAAAAGAYYEEQMPQFRSVIRDNRKYPMSNSGNNGQPHSGVTPPLGQSTNYAGQRVQMTPMQMVQLRAAIAAINTESIRNIHSDTGTPSSSTHMTRSRRVVLADTSGNPAFEVEVFGNDIQPYISQMYAQVTDPAGGEDNFIAIQLVNPDTKTDITIGANWTFASINRLATITAGAPNLSLSFLGNGNGNIVIPHSTVSGGVTTMGYVTLYDGSNPPSGFKIPPSTTPKANGNAYAVAGLAGAIGNELIILRPRRLDGTLSKSPVIATNNSYFDRYDETNIYDLVPVDQLDMTGTLNVSAATNNLYYRRGADPAATTPGAPTFAWNFVWPGFYTPYNINNIGGQTTQAPYTPTSSPISTYVYNQPIVANATPPTPANPDFTKLCSGVADPSAATATSPTYNTMTLQLVNTSLPGVNPVGSAPDRFPFGGFARNGDILQIPFIGAYRIIDHHLQLDDPLNTSHQFYEMNSVTMDASLANDSTLQPSAAYTATYHSKVTPSTAAQTTPVVAADTVKDPFVEQIGHFCPIGDVNYYDTLVTPTPYGFGTIPDPTYQLDFGQAATNPSANWHYHWAKRIFDYFTVQSPVDDNFPNADIDADFAKYAVTSTQKFTTPVPTAIPTTTSGTAGDIVGVEGLININTAPWPVLATLPFVPRHVAAGGTPLTDYLNYNTGTTLLGTGEAKMTPGGSANAIDDNIDLAKAIVDYRNANGPFKSIMDLYNVPAFRLENDALLSQATEPGVAQGDFSPGPLGSVTPGTDADGARFDFEERFLLLNHISNLITTRSDTFTCYVDLQGWRNVGTGNPTLAVERRKAFIFDRTTYAPTYKNATSFPVPGN